MFRCATIGLGVLLVASAGIADSVEPAAATAILAPSGDWIESPRFVESFDRGSLADSLPTSTPLWIWSSARAARRATLGDAPRLDEIEREDPTLTVVVHPEARPRDGEPPTELWVVSGPVAMWREVPESYFPSWGGGRFEPRGAAPRRRALARAPDRPRRGESMDRRPGRPVARRCPGHGRPHRGDRRAIERRGAGARSDAPIRRRRSSRRVDRPRRRPHQR